MLEYERNAQNINRKYREYFVPTVLNLMAVNIATTVDSVIVGNMIGKEALGAVGLMAPVVQIYGAFASIIGLGLSSVISIAKGENDKKKADRLYTSGLILLGFSIVFLMAVQLVMKNNICGWVAGNGTMTEGFMQYYFPFILATPLLLVQNVSVHILRLDGRPRFAANLIIMSNIVNLCMDILYIRVFHWGLVGASAATATGQLVAILVMMTHFIKRKNTLHFDKNLWKSGGFFGCLKEIVPTGLSSALGVLLLTVKIQFMLMLAKQCIGEAGVIAYSIYRMVLLMVSMFIGGGSQTMIPIVGMCIGERDFEGVRFTFRRAVKILVTAAVVIAVLTAAFPFRIAKLFGINDAAALKEVVSALRITAVSLVGVAISFLLLYYYSAIKEKKISVTISVMNTVGFVIPSALICTHFWGITGVWVSFIVSEVLTLVMAYIITRVCIKRSNGKFTDFYMVPRSDENTVMSLSFYAKEQTSAGVSEYITTALQDCGGGMDNQMIGKIALAIEDTTAHLAYHTTKETMMDVRIIKGEETVVSVRYNGSPYNPLLAGETELFEAFSVVKSISREVTYSNVLGFNRVMIKL